MVYGVHPTPAVPEYFGMSALNAMLYCHLFFSNRDVDTPPHVSKFRVQHTNCVVYNLFNL